jgi:hypothetical protein
MWKALKKKVKAKNPHDKKHEVRSIVLGLLHTLQLLTSNALFTPARLVQIGGMRRRRRVARVRQTHLSSHTPPYH